MKKFNDPFGEIIRVHGSTPAADSLLGADDPVYDIDPSVHYYDPMTRKFNLPPLPPNYDTSKNMGRAALTVNDSRATPVTEISTMHTRYAA